MGDMADYTNDQGAREETARQFHRLDPNDNREASEGTNQPPLPRTCPKCNSPLIDDGLALRCSSTLAYGTCNFSRVWNFTRTSSVNHSPHNQRRDET